MFFKRAIFSSIALLSVVTLTFTVACKQKNISSTGEPMPVALEYSADVNYEVVSQYTSSVISSESPILFSFAREAVAVDKIGSEAKGCSIKPNVSGKFQWLDARSITFIPEKPLQRGTVYTVSFTPSNVSENFAEYTNQLHFSFSIVELRTFLTLDQDFIFPDTNNINALELKGIIESNEALDPQSIEKDLTVTLDGKKIPVRWSHSKLSHQFTLQGITKSDTKTQNLVVEYNAYRYANRTIEKQERTIPVILKELVVLGCDAVDTAERYILVRFSSPLLESQDFSGYVTMSPSRNLRYIVEGAHLKVYSIDGWPDRATITVATGLKDRGQAVIMNAFEQDVAFTSEAPGLRFAGSGVIVPSVSNAKFPIETVNLYGVIVTIEKVYEENLGQFLQVNELNQNNEMHRVGKQIWKKIVPIDFKEENRNKWITTNLDLSPLFVDGSHNLYRISLSCDIRMSAYPGASEVSESDLAYHKLSPIELASPSQSIRSLSDGFWATQTRAPSDDTDDYYYYYYDRAYSRRYSGSAYPNIAAYFFNRTDYYASTSVKKNPVRASRNVMVSNIGIIAQSDATKRLVVAVSQLTDAQPIRAAKVSIRNYQNREIAGGQTDQSGLASFEGIQDAYLVVVEAEKDRGFLKLQGASNQPVSHFEVSGQSIQQGVKGYIYGERGVWRPGDAIYLTFVLNDTNKILPPNHPAVLTFYDPQGRYRETVKNTAPVGNFYSFQLKTSSEDITGSYTAQIQIGALTFSKEIPVETIKPNRLKIDFSIDGNPSELDTAKMQANIHATWLHGTDADGLKADVNARFSSMPTTFKGYSDYVFDDPIRQYDGELHELYGGNLDSSGKTSFPIRLSSDTIAPGKLVANIKTRVYEAGGNINTDTFNIPFNPYSQYVGLSVVSTNKDYGWSRNYQYIDTTKKNPVKIALLDTQGKPVKKGSVEVSVYNLGWRWWWERGEENLVNYLGSGNYSLLTREKVKITNGEALWNLNLDSRRDLWGRHIIRVRDLETGHASGSIVYFYYPGWYFRSTEENNQSPSMLSFSADKTKFEAGETATISIPSSAGAQILVSIENNGKLVKSEIVQATKDTTSYKLKITGDMVPNIYVHAMHVQSYDQSGNDRPIRLYGVIPLDVEDPATTLTPIVEAASSFEPSTKATITVSEKSGQEMTYTLAIVDEGLLNITRFMTPNAWLHFFQRDALAVRTFDIYGFVSQTLGFASSRMLKVGGGEDYSAGQKEKANRFPPMVRFMGPFTLEKGKKVTHEIQMPQYIGAVRLMLVAGNQKAFGSAEKTVPVKKPIMTYSVLPRVVSIGETVQLPISVFALENSIKSVQVHLNVTGALEIVESDTITLSFSKPGDELATFKLKAKGSAGIAKIEVTATSGSIVSSESIEIDVRVPSPPITVTSSLYMLPGEKKSINFSYPGLSGTNTLKLEYSKIQPIDLERRLGFLVNYPYGCIEQTTSAVFPQLFLDKITEVPKETLAQIRTNVQAGINNLSSFQVSNGGLSYWPRQGNRSAYGTVYAAHFIFEAEALGYTVPASLKDTVIRGLKEIAQGKMSDDYSSDLVVAYALFDLALAGKPEIGLMNRLKEKSNLHASAQYKLAAAYSLIGQKTVSSTMLEKLGVPSTSYSELGGSYGSDTRDLAMLVEAFVASDQISKAVPLVDTLSKRLSSERWYSTQTTAYSLLAIGKFLQISDIGKGDEPMKISYTWNGAKITDESARSIGSASLKVTKLTETDSILCENISKTPLFVRVIATGLPDPMTVQPSSSGLSMKIVWTDKKGNPLDITNLKQGTDIVADVIIKNESGRRMENLALETLMPSGWEITNPRFEGWENQNDSTFTYQDIRDDRVYTFFDMDYYSAKQKNYRFLMTATYEGTFYLPVFKVSAMYDNAFSATSQAQWVTVFSDIP